MTIRIFVFLAIIFGIGTSAKAQEDWASVADTVLDRFFKESFFTINRPDCVEPIRGLVLMALNGEDTSEANTNVVGMGCLDRHSAIYATPYEIDDTGVRAVKQNPLENKETVDHWKAYPVAYVKIEGFSSRTASELEIALKGLQNERIILDLRGNLGGDLGALIKSAYLFAPYAGAPMFVQWFRTGHIRFFAPKRGLYAGHSMAILVDKNTASASEILAALLKWWYKDDVVIMGEPTYGKSTAQLCLVCNALIQARLTIALITIGTLSEGIRIHGVGIHPEVPVLSEAALNRALRFYDAIP